MSNHHCCNVNDLTATELEVRYKVFKPVYSFIKLAYAKLIVPTLNSSDAVPRYTLEQLRDPPSAILGASTSLDYDGFNRMLRGFLSFEIMSRTYQLDPRSHFEDFETMRNFNWRMAQSGWQVEELSSAYHLYIEVIGLLVEKAQLAGSPAAVEHSSVWEGLTADPKTGRVSSKILFFANRFLVDCAFC